MREQQQEQERREALNQAQQEQNTSSSLKVPVNIHNIDVPPQVLQVCTDVLGYIYGQFVIY